jgi:hypothetical protein
MRKKKGRWEGKHLRLGKRVSSGNMGVSLHNKGCYALQLLSPADR